MSQGCDIAAVCSGADRCVPVRYTDNSQRKMRFIDHLKGHYSFMMGPNGIEIEIS